MFNEVICRGILFLITFSILRMTIKDFQLNWKLVLTTLLIILTIYFGRNAVGYTLQIINSKKGVKKSALLERRFVILFFTIKF